MKKKFEAQVNKVFENICDVIDGVKECSNCCHYEYRKYFDDYIGDCSEEILALKPKLKEPYYFCNLTSIRVNADFYCEGYINCRGNESECYSTVYTNNNKETEDCVDLSKEDENSVDEDSEADLEMFSNSKNDQIINLFIKIIALMGDYNEEELQEAFKDIRENKEDKVLGNLGSTYLRSPKITDIPIIASEKTRPKATGATLQPKVKSNILHLTDLNEYSQPKCVLCGKALEASDLVVGNIWGYIGTCLKTDTIRPCTEDIPVDLIKKDKTLSSRFNKKR